MCIVVISHLFTCLKNLCCFCGGTKHESNTVKRYPLTPHHIFSLSLLTMSLLTPASDQLVVRGGNAHFFTYTRIRSRETGENKTDEQTRTKLGVTKSRGRYCNTICMCGLSLAWVTSENSTMLLESDILRLFFTGPYLVSSPLCSGVWCWLPLRGSTPTSLFASLLSSLNCPPWFPAATASLLSCHQLFSLLSNYQLSLSGSRRQLSFASPYHFRVQRDFMSKNPLSGFAPKQTIESSALAAYPHSATIPIKYGWELSHTHSLQIGE